MAEGHRRSRPQGQAVEALTPSQRRHIERWLSRRGLPQLIEGYGTERSIDTRAARWLLLWMVIQLVMLCWSADIAAELRVAAIAVGLAGLALGLVLHRRVTGRDLFRPRDRLSIVDIPLFGLYPAVVAFIRFGDVGSAIDMFFFSMEGVLLIYLFIGFGVLWIVAWSIGWLVSQLPHLIGLAARTLPLVLILVIFLLFASELWQAAATASLAELLAAIVLAAVIGFAFLVSRAGTDLRELTSSARRTISHSDVRGTPAEALVGAQTTGSAPPELGRLQRWNLQLVLVISQAFQATLVSIIVVVFLIMIGLLLAPASVQELWTGAGVRELLVFDALDERRVLSQELLVVASLLGTFAGVYFAGFALDDERYRLAAMSNTLADLRRALAVRELYVLALGSMEPAEQPALEPQSPVAAC